MKIVAIIALLSLACNLCLLRWINHQIDELEMALQETEELLKELEGGTSDAKHL